MDVIGEHGKHVGRLADVAPGGAQDKTTITLLEDARDQALDGPGPLSCRTSRTQALRQVRALRVDLDFG
ncbi:hypothetical protein [Nonomuraea wenchangensis]|uniref:hypothetical protein n=1 Tax=Nonomuraea wenchangensis TaxID=568860 RepID=UPI0037A0BD50